MNSDDCLHPEGMWYVLDGQFVQFLLVQKLEEIKSNSGPILLHSLSHKFS